MQDTFVTFHGWVGSDVRYRAVGETTVASFRVGVTPRLRRQEAWVDGETTWYSVTVWRTLADHVRQSIRKGDPVIVHGRLRTETWTPEKGSPSTALLVEATLVGHDLNRGCSSHWKARPLEPAASPAITPPQAESGEATEQPERSIDKERSAESDGAESQMVGHPDGSEPAAHTHAA